MDDGVRDDDVEGVDTEEYTDSAASSGPEDAEVQEHQQDQAEQGAAQGGKGRVE